jgi:hypothetical protein
MQQSRAVERPSDDDQVWLADALRWQAQYCAGRGSPIAARICDTVSRASADLLGDELPERVRFGDLIGLRVMATVHRLALQRLAPEVAMHLPTLGGTPPIDARSWQAFDSAVITALLEHPRALAWSLDHVPQTNETGRAVLLRRGLSLLGELGLPGPVRLLEIGSSAGLNLRADHLPGNPLLEAGPMPPIIERLGCDLHPIDPTTQDGRTTLSSYIWVDDVERFQRLGQALRIAAEVRATVRKSSALTFVSALSLQEGAVTLVWHSAMWLYMPIDSRQGIQRRLAELGGTASATAPLVHLSWEWQPGGEDTFTLVLRAWNGREHSGEPLLLATGASHGSPVQPIDAQPMTEDPLAVPLT